MKNYRLIIIKINAGLSQIFALFIEALAIITDLEIRGIDLIVQAELPFLTHLSLQDNNITHRGVK